MDTQESKNPEFTSKEQSLSYIENDRIFYFVLKKAERLTAAVYMTSGILSDNEPLKWHVRQESLRFLEGVRALHGENHAGHFDALLHCAQLAEGVVAVLEIARLSGLISDMNFSLLKKEYLHLIELLRKDPSANGLAKDIPITQEFLKVDESVTPAPVNTMSFSGRGNAMSALDKKEGSGGEEGGTSIRQLKDSNNVLKNVPYRSFSAPLAGLVPKEKGKRRTTIIKLLQRKSDLTIKDIAQAIPGCSEKTVQRELIALIKDNLVVRAGERRWSRYSIRA